MATIKTCDRCGKVLKEKRYFCGYFNSFGDDCDTEESIHVDLCGDCYDKFNNYFLKMSGEKFTEVNASTFENDIIEWQKNKIKEALNGNNKNM